VGEVGSVPVSVHGSVAWDTCSSARSRPASAAAIDCVRLRSTRVVDWSWNESCVASTATSVRTAITMMATTIAMPDSPERWRRRAGGVGVLIALVSLLRVGGDGVADERVVAVLGVAPGDARREADVLAALGVDVGDQRHLEQPAAEAGGRVQCEG